MSATRQPPAPDTATPAKSSAQKFDTVAVSTLSFGHFVHDTYPAFLGALMPLLGPKLDLTMAAAGALAGVLRWSAVIQPFLGVLADRTDLRYWVILAPTATALGMSLLGLAPNYLSVIVLLILTGLSHAAFHPAATALVTRSSGQHWGKGTSFFMTGGELGRALGPLYIVACVQAFGLEGSWVAVSPAILASLLLYWRIGRGPRLTLPSKGGGLWAAMKMVRRSLVVLSAVIVFRNLANTSFVFFFPTYLTQNGIDLVFAGLALSVFELAGAAGAFIGGTLSDRLGRRQILVAGQIIAGPALFGALAFTDGPIQLVMLAIAGFASLSGSPVQLVLIQELLPENRSAAAGIMMFLGIEGTIVTTMSVGFLADVFGLGPALTWSVILSVFSIPFVLMLPETRRAR